MTNISDVQLAVKTKSGDTNSWGELFVRYNSKAVMWAAGVLGVREDAEDVVADVFADLPSHVSTFCEEHNFEPWFRRRIEDRCRNFLKRRKLETVPIGDVEHLL